MIKNKIIQTLREAFYILTIAIVVFSILEFFWPRIVIAYINLNLVLIFWIIISIIILLIGKIKKYE